ncbi:BZ3500_MvSof-1268-A1-R1_Chr3-1g06120 [Microbotryum saponariae]|uniref:BZ3500_MvSof-1268-A1-R1_Chr3-1g06120 protein n=1 Tax=Microbotryum saponariae TaxID=289078 RepID=A0A2X0KZC8_9BASI|nr:BZ3500_MvSof-1268-A1-R1_Chr3-1g06120 [Microbotryum saponariae]SDA03983.1 BZ3501_MvSof-1269-A2-R1_Chr3-2g05805 [Microbotryum saponariae]
MASTSTLPPSRTAPSTSRPATTTSITSPTELVAAWKKEGLFDALRKQLIHDFSQSDDKDSFLIQLDDKLAQLVADPSFARLNKKDRSLHLYNSTEGQSQLLQQTSAATDRRLRAKQAGQSESSLEQIEKGLRATLNSLRGKTQVVEDVSKKPPNDKMDVEEGPNGAPVVEEVRKASTNGLMSTPIDTIADTKISEPSDGSPRTADP